MPHFILKVRKKNGSKNHPNSLYQTVCGLQRHIQRTRPKASFFHPTFTNIQRTLDAEMKRLRTTGLGMQVKQSDPISIEERL